MARSLIIYQVCSTNCGGDNFCADLVFTLFRRKNFIQPNKSAWRLNRAAGSFFFTGAYILSKHPLTHIENPLTYIEAGLDGFKNVRIQICGELDKFINF